MRLWSWWVCPALLLQCAAWTPAAAQSVPAPKKLETAAVKTQASPASGPELYKAYCASCHGSDAKGGGPAAEALRMRPSDLTLLSRKNGGRFPVYRVQHLLGGADELVPHGSKTMPVWGPVFRTMNRDEGLSAMRIRNLVSYLESIQAK